MVDLILKNPPKNIVGITGLPRSGKSMLAPIISSFNRSETLTMDYVLEEYPVLNYLGLITDHVTKYMMRYLVNILIYNKMIGRNSNFRPSDWTSIWHSKDPSIYVKRILSEEGDSVYETIKEKEPLIPFMFHNALWHSNIFFQSFPDIKMIHINRHPVDVIHSWFKRGYSSEFYLKERSALTLIDYRGNNIPYYAKGWEKDYCNLSDMDKIIHMIYFINSNHNKSYIKLTKKKQNQVVLINFDRMVTKPNNDISIMTKFLNTEKTSYTKKVMDRERCPRKIDMNERETKFKEIKKLASTDSVHFLEEMMDQYEKERSL